MNLQKLRLCSLSAALIFFSSAAFSDDKKETKIGDLTGVNKFFNILWLKDSSKNFSSEWICGTSGYLEKHIKEAGLESVLSKPTVMPSAPGEKSDVVARYTFLDKTYAGYSSKIYSALKELCLIYRNSNLKELAKDLSPTIKAENFKPSKGAEAVIKQTEQYLQKQKCFYATNYFVGQKNDQCSPQASDKKECFEKGVDGKGHLCAGVIESHIIGYDGTLNTVASPVVMRLTNNRDSQSKSEGTGRGKMMESRALYSALQYIFYTVYADLLKKQTFNSEFLIKHKNTYKHEEQRKDGSVANETTLTCEKENCDLNAMMFKVCGPPVQGLSSTDGCYKDKNQTTQKLPGVSKELSGLLSVFYKEFTEAKSHLASAKSKYFADRAGWDAAMKEKIHVASGDSKDEDDDDDSGRACPPGTQFAMTPMEGVPGASLPSCQPLGQQPKKEEAKPESPKDDGEQPEETPPQQAAETPPPEEQPEKDPEKPEVVKPEVKCPPNYTRVDGGCQFTGPDPNAKKETPPGETADVGVVPDTTGTGAGTTTGTTSTATKPEGPQPLKGNSSDPKTASVDNRRFGGIGDTPPNGNPAAGTLLKASGLSPGQVVGEKPHDDTKFGDGAQAVAGANGSTGSSGGNASEEAANNGEQAGQNAGFNSRTLSGGRHPDIFDVAPCLNDSGNQCLVNKPSMCSAAAGFFNLVMNCLTSR